MLGSWTGRGRSDVWVRTCRSGKGQAGCRRAFEGVMAELPNQGRVQGHVHAESPHDSPLIPHENGRSQRVQRFQDWKKLATHLEFKDLGSIPGSGRSPGERNGYPLQYSRLENSTDRRVWWATVHGVAKSWTRLRD